MSHIRPNDDGRRPDQVVSVSLTADQRQLLVCGLVEWGGPASPTDAIAQAIGFSDRSDLRDEGYRIADDLRRGEMLTRRDWTRALLATEIVFASDVVGSGIDWMHTTGFDDVATIQALRVVQRLLVGVVVRESE